MFLLNDEPFLALSEDERTRLLALWKTPEEISGYRYSGVFVPRAEVMFPFLAEVRLMGFDFLPVPCLCGSGTNNIWLIPVGGYFHSYKAGWWTGWAGNEGVVWPKTPELAEASFLSLWGQAVLSPDVDARTMLVNILRWAYREDYYMALDRGDEQGALFLNRVLRYLPRGTDEGFWR